MFRLHGKAFIEALWNAGLAGKPWAMKLILDRILPAATAAELREQDYATVSDESLMESLELFLTRETRRDKATDADTARFGAASGAGSEPRRVLRA